MCRNDSSFCDDRNTGMAVRRDVEAADAKARHAASMVFPIGQPNEQYARYFTGASYLASVSLEQIGVYNVTFEPGCRNNWHVYRVQSGGGQILICIAGMGYDQEWGREAVELLPGSVVNIPARVKHWHGAAPDSWVFHLAMEVPGEGSSNEWLEAVGDQAYLLAASGRN